MKKEKNNVLNKRAHSSDSNIVTFGKEEIDVSKLSDEELTELYEKMEDRKVSLASKIIALNDENNLFTQDEINQMLNLL